MKVGDALNCKLKRYRKELRAGMVLLALPMFLIGVWGLIAPHGFYDAFPGGGRHWLSAYGPYDEHLVRDFAALNLALGFLLVISTLTLDRRLVQGALGAVAVYSAPHLGFHLAHPHALGTSDNVLSDSGLALNLLVPLAMLWLTTGTRQAGAPAPRRSAPAHEPVARIAAKGGALVRFTNWYTRHTYGREVTVTPVIAHSRPTMLGWGMLEWFHERSGSVDEKLKLLAATKAATMIGCEFCIDIGSHLGREAGVTEEQLRDFHNYGHSQAFSPVEKLVMDYGAEMSKANVEISDDLFARLREHFDDEQLVELTAAIAIENYRARFNNALGVPPAGFSEGAFCPMPERRQDAVATGPGSA
jgi:AhpD family alkylhydroperoxidase